MITAAEARELLDLVHEGPGHLSDAYQRLIDLATRVARDYEVMELSLLLTAKCEEMGAYPDESAPAELYAEIREIAEKLAALDPES